MQQDYSTKDTALGFFIIAGFIALVVWGVIHSNGGDDTPQRSSTCDLAEARDIVLGVYAANYQSPTEAEVDEGIDVWCANR